MSDEDEKDGNSSATSSGDESSQSEMELMITTRERRRTAGNRYSQIVSQEQADEDEQDDVALLFAEAEGEDEEYNSDEADDEADMSSSDDDDQGPDAGHDELEGEKELQQEAKTARQKKRKADMAMTTLSAIKKKPRIDPTSLHRAPDKQKPSKRKERVSWLPDESVAPGRTSLRKQTVAHRETMMERLKESEEQRLRNKAIREQKERIKRAEAPRQLTQADRLAEAEKNERRNAKSLNRWEAMEAKRAEEQAARLAALKDRKLSGPVFTFYSSVHTYRGPKLERLSPGPGGLDEVQAKKRGRKSKAALEMQTTTIPAPQHLTTEPAPAAASSSGLRTPNTTESEATAAASGAVKADSGLAGNHEYVPVPSLSTSSQITPRENHDTNPPTEEDQHPSAPVAKEPTHATPINQKDAASKEAHPPDSASAQVEETSSHGPQSGMEHGRVLAQEPRKQEDTESGRVPLPMEDIQPREPEVSKVGNTDLDGVSSTTEEAHRPSDAPENAHQPVMPQAQLDPTHSADAGKVAHTPTSQEQSQAEQDQRPKPQPVPTDNSIAPSNGEPARVQDSRSYPSIAHRVPAIQLVPPKESQGPLQSEEQTQPSPLPMVEVVSTRNLVILDNFEDLTAEARQAYSVFYGTKKVPKPAKHVTEVCAITGLPARYRDPMSGAGYANVHAFRQLKKLQKHAFQWSGMLGCYVGRTDHVARGVPRAFLGNREEAVAPNSRV